MKSKKRAYLLRILFGLFTFLAFAPMSYGIDQITKIDGSGHITLLIPLFALGSFLLFVSRKKQSQKTQKKQGFTSITPHKPPKFFALDESVDSMEKIVESLADESTNVYSNLSKITLTVKPTGVFLEDKNYKISILVNRRRSRRCYLADGDIIDMGELTLVYNAGEVVETPSEAKKVSKGSHYAIPRARRAQGKLLRGCPSLIPLDSRKKTYYLTKNITFIGRSECNDLIPKAKAVSQRHSRIEKVAGRYKLVDLNSTSGTFINGKRVEWRFLKDGDEISFESVKYVFSMAGRSR